MSHLKPIHSDTCCHYQTVTFPTVDTTQYHITSTSVALTAVSLKLQLLCDVTPCDAMSSNEWLLTFRRKRVSLKRREPSSHRQGVTCRKNWILIIRLRNHFASVRLKVCRFSAIRAFFSVDRLVNQEVKTLCWDTRRHTDRPFTSLCLPAACKWRRLVSLNHCLFLRVTFPLQTNKQRDIHIYKRPDGFLRTKNTASVIKTPNNEAEVACSLCPRNAISLHFPTKATLFSITQFRFTNAPAVLEGKIISDVVIVIALQGRWQPSERVAVSQCSP